LDILGWGSESYIKWREGFEPKRLIIAPKTLAFFLELIIQLYDPGALFAGIIF
tara:strand:+ start:1194 stop:1352 length:159 start_codon:yes stop_codon:yes gene_type:complete